jgi:drug/metabolite transporter (DMT)-like permease
MAPPPVDRTRAAAVLAVFAAFIWATYYYFVLSLHVAAPAAVLAYPFLAAGAAFVVWAGLHGQLRSFVAIWRMPTAYLRAALLLGMQVSVLAATYAAGPVDTSLLSLVGDVVVTPILLMVIYREGGERLRAPAFLAGLVLSTVGASLTIVGGAHTNPITGWAWLIAPAVPLTVAFYFLLSARENRRIPMAAVIGQATLAAGLLTVAVSPFLPGGFGGLGLADGHDALFLVALGLSSFFVAPLAYFRAIELGGLLLPALLMATIPVFTLLVELAAFHVVPAWLALLGIPIAVLGGALAVRGGHVGWTPVYATVPGGAGK